MVIDRRVLLGIGVGLMLAGAVAGTGGDRSKSPSDLEVVRRAKALGMVFAGEERLGFPAEKPSKPTATVGGMKGQQRSGPRTVVVEIPAGASAGEVARVLRGRSLIADEREFLRLAEEEKAAARFQAGTYRVASNITVRELIKTLVSGPRSVSPQPE